MSSVILASELDQASNHYLDIISKGFTVGDSGLYFPCGLSNLKLEKGQPDALLVVSKVAVRRTEAVKLEQVNKDLMEAIQRTKRVDSLFVEEEDSGDRHPFKSNFILFNSEQILPEFLVFVRSHELSYGVLTVKAALRDLQPEPCKGILRERPLRHVLSMRRGVPPKLEQSGFKARPC